MSSNAKEIVLPPKTRKRPFGVIVIIVLQLVSVAGAALDIYLTYNGITDAIFTQTVHTGGIPTFNLVAIVLGLVISFGLWQLKRWAWFLVMVQLGISMAGGLWLYTQGNPYYSNMVIDVIAVFYLNQREVQQAFEREHNPQGVAL